MSDHATVRMTDEAFERIADRVECFDLLTVEGRRARDREKALEDALRGIADGRSNSDLAVHCRRYRRVARAALEAGKT